MNGLPYARGATTHACTPPRAFAEPCNVNAALGGPGLCLDSGEGGINLGPEEKSTLWGKQLIECCGELWNKVAVCSLFFSSLFMFR